MKYLNIKLLKEKDACDDGYIKFAEAHGNKDVTWVDALESNGWDDIWWALSEFSDNLTDSQNKDLRLLSADYAEDCLHLFEKDNSEDKRPRLAIEAARQFASGEITKEELAAARDAARAARDAARDAAWAAAGADGAARAARAAARAAGAAWDAARAAAGAAAWDAAGAAGAAWAAGAARAAAMEKQTKQLKKALLGWG